MHHSIVCRVFVCGQTEGRCNRPLCKACSSAKCVTQSILLFREAVTAAREALKEGMMMSVSAAKVTVDDIAWIDSIGAETILPESAASADSELTFGQVLIIVFAPQAGVKRAMVNEASRARREGLPISSMYASTLAYATCYDSLESSGALESGLPSFHACVRS